MSAEVVLRQPAAPARMTVPDKMQYAQALAGSGMLPAQYRRQPANLLYAVEYAEMLGMHPLTAVTGIHVIEGKPSASAALISALVRRAGHRLRVSGDDTRAVAEIVRADDPEFTFRSEWTIDRAKQAGLAGKNVWKQYPAAMLKARAITEVARDACEDALAGLHYTAEELGAEVDDEGIPTAVVVEPDEPVDPNWADPVVTDEQWRDGWLIRLGEAASKSVLRGLWGELVEQHKARQVTDGDRAILEVAFREAAQDVDEITRKDNEDAQRTFGPDAGEPAEVVEAGAA